MYTQNYIYISYLYNYLLLCSDHPHWSLHPYDPATALHQAAVYKYISRSQCSTASNPQSKGHFWWWGSFNQHLGQKFRVVSCAELLRTRPVEDWGRIRVNFVPTMDHHSQIIPKSGHVPTSKRNRTVFRHLDLDPRTILRFIFGYTMIWYTPYVRCCKWPPVMASQWDGLLLDIIGFPKLLSVSSSYQDGTRFLRLPFIHVFSTRHPMGKGAKII